MNQASSYPDFARSMTDALARSERNDAEIIAQRTDDRARANWHRRFIDSENKTMALRATMFTMLLLGANTAQAALPTDTVEVRKQYICASGRLLDVLYRNPTHLALITVGDRQETLFQSPVADGFRYIGGENEIRGKGDSITAKVFPNPGVACVAKPAVTQPGTITGTTAYKTRNALPKEGIVVTVDLRDVSRADAAASVLGTTKLTTTGNQQCRWHG